MCFLSLIVVKPKERFKNQLLVMTHLVISFTFFRECFYSCFVWIGWTTFPVPEVAMKFAYCIYHLAYPILQGTREHSFRPSSLGLKMGLDVGFPKSSWGEAREEPPQHVAGLLLPYIHKDPFFSFIAFLYFLPFVIINLLLLFLHIK